jgi:DNA repair protein RecO (recombination protein O)
MPRPRLYQTEAIVLRGIDFGEADRILTLLTPRHGKLKAIAKGVRRPISRQAGHLELFNHVDLLLAVGRELDVITQSQVKNPFRGLRENLERTSHAYYLAELVDHLVEDRVDAPEVFELAQEGLAALDSSGNGRLVLVQAQLALLGESGFGPELFQCVGCRTELRPEVNAFAPASGGMLCPDCAAGDPLSHPLSLGALKLLRHLRRAGLQGSVNVRVPDGIVREVTRAMGEYVERVVERRIRSAEFIARLSQA